MGWRRLLLVLVMTSIAPASAGAQSDEWQLGATPTFSSGRYGGDTPTEIVYTPIVARRLFADGDLTFVLPHICISGDGGVTIVGGAPARTTAPSERPATRERAARAAAAGVRGGSTASDASAASSDTGTISPNVRHCGLGDIVVRGRYYVLDERGWLPTVAIRGHVKAPTADDTRGLGTGRADQGVALEASRMLARGFTVMADGGYTIVGKPADADFRNTWWYDAGVAQDLARGVINLSVFFEEYRSIVPSFENARDILVTVGLKTASGWRLQVSGEVGLSDGAPDRGFTFGASRRF